MNDQIKEIFKRAGGKTSVHNLMSNPMQRREYHELWDERIVKFAELIVKECAEIALREEHDPYECILKHFGVEE